MAEEQKNKTVKKTTSTNRKTTTKTVKKTAKPDISKEKEIDKVVPEVKPIENVEIPAPEVIVENKPEVEEKVIENKEAIPQPIEVTPVEPIASPEPVKVESAPSAIAPQEVSESRVGNSGNEAPSFPINEEMGKGNVTATLEAKRVAFYSSFKKYRLISYILMGIGLALMVVLFIFLFLDSNKFQILIYVLLGVTIAALVSNLVFNRMTQKKQGAALQGYVNNIMIDIASASYYDTGVTDVKIMPNSIIKDSEVINAHLFTVINKIKSRCRVVSKLNNRTLVSADVSVVIPKNITQGKEKPSEAFGIYGKYFAYDLALANKEAVIIMRTATNSIIPNHLIGYHAVTVEELNSAFIVYGTSDEIVTKLLKPDMVALLNGFEPSNVMFDYVISVNDHGAFFGLNYSDAVMALPINKPVDKEAFEKLKSDTEKVCQFFSLLK